MKKRKRESIVQKIQHELAMRYMRFLDREIAARRERESKKGDPVHAMP